MALPDAVDYGQVRWHAVTAAADGVDVDGDPDAIPVTGTVKFTPSATVLLATEGADPITVFATTVTYTIDADGILRDSQGRALITLVATDSPGLTPTGWTWKATYNLNGGVSRGSFSFALPAGTVVDLTRVSPVSSSNGMAGVSRTLKMGYGRCPGLAATPRRPSRPSRSGAARWRSTATSSG